MKTVEYKISDLIDAEYNPRSLSDKQFRELQSSLKRFGLVEPILININKDRKNIIVGGHQRTKVWASLGNEKIDCVEIDLTLEQEKELNIRLNKNGGEFDFEMLAEHFDEKDLMDFGFDDFELDEGFELAGVERDGDGGDPPDEDDEKYSQSVESPIYEPTGEKPDISELYDTTKTDELISNIKDKKDLPLEVVNFLIHASRRHTVFDYQHIAEFYAHADEETQALFEESALVIIDFDKAIENGFVKLNKRFAENRKRDYPDEE